MQEQSCGLMQGGRTLPTGGGRVLERLWGGLGASEEGDTLSVGCLWERDSSGAPPDLQGGSTGRSYNGKTDPASEGGCGAWRGRTGTCSLSFNCGFGCLVRGWQSVPQGLWVMAEGRFWKT